jgi:hypothetical protein
MKQRAPARAAANAASAVGASVKQGWSSGEANTGSARQASRNLRHNSRRPPNKRRLGLISSNKPSGASMDTCGVNAAASPASRRIRASSAAGSRGRGVMAGAAVSAALNVMPGRTPAASARGSTAMTRWLRSSASMMTNGPAVAATVRKATSGNRGTCAATHSSRGSRASAA